MTGLRTIQGFPRPTELGSLASATSPINTGEGAPIGKPRNTPSTRVNFAIVGGAFAYRAAITAARIQVIVAAGDAPLCLARTRRP
jgi:hypothetical protein